MTDSRSSFRNSAATVRSGSSSRRRPRDRRRRGPELAGLPARDQHGLDPIGSRVPGLSTRAPGELDHLGDLLLRVRHHGRSPEGEREVRRVVHHDEIGDVVDEGRLGPHPIEKLGREGPSNRNRRSSKVLLRRGFAVSIVAGKVPTGRKRGRTR